jgi:hypothetical protein
MPLMGFDLVKAQALQRRIVYIGGAFGTGKTALSFRMVPEFLDDSSTGLHYVASNIDSVWTDKLEHIQMDDEGRLNSVFILDEAGEFIDSMKDVKGWISYLRKLNVVLILASAVEPHSVMRRFELRRTINWQVFGFPATSWRWIVDTGVSSKERYVSAVFHWWKPSEIYGVYDTDAAPGDAMRLKTYLEDAIEVYRRVNPQEVEDGTSAEQTVSRESGQAKATATVKETSAKRTGKQTKAAGKKGTAAAGGQAAARRSSQAGSSVPEAGQGGAAQAAPQTQLSLASDLDFAVQQLENAGRDAQDAALETSRQQAISLLYRDEKKRR